MAATAYGSGSPLEFRVNVRMSALGADKIVVFSEGAVTVRIDVRFGSWLVSRLLLVL